MAAIGRKRPPFLSVTLTQKRLSKAPCPLPNFGQSFMRVFCRSAGLNLQRWRTFRFLQRRVLLAAMVARWNVGRQ